MLGVGVVIAGAVPFLISATTPTRAKAEGPTTIVIPASEGYGVSDCLEAGAECGQIIASSWCAAHGFGRATAFGYAKPEDMTATTVSTQAAPKAIAVTCED